MTIGSSAAESSEPSEPINVSALNQYAYCPRRCGLIYLEGEFADNVHTSRGNAEHARVDRVAHATGKDGARVEYALPIFSDRLGLIGKCDVVEFWPDGTVYPVEYKHGPRRAWLNDDVQVGAQALCLEDMLGVTIGEAAVFHASSKRRRVVHVDAALRDAVVMTVNEIRRMLARRELPPRTTDIRRCRECSLRDTCRPEFSALQAKAKELLGNLFNPDQ
jgi:CRISPR-associated exonuclease Cas4